MIFWRCCVEAAVFSRRSAFACEDTRHAPLHPIEHVILYRGAATEGGPMRWTFPGLAEFAGDTPAATDFFTLPPKPILRSINHRGFRPYGLGGGVGRGRRVGRGLGVTLGVEVGLTLGEGVVVGAGVAVGFGVAVAVGVGVGVTGGVTVGVTLGVGVGVPVGNLNL